MSALTVSPAYGRDYTTHAKAIAAWRSDYDFLCETIDGQPQRFTYVNRANALMDNSISEVRIRFARLSRVAILRRALW